MQRSIHRLGIFALLLFAALVLASCSGGSIGGSAPPPPPPPPVTPTDVPEAPTSVITTAVSDTQINISWSSVSAATSYSVYRSEQTGTAYICTAVSGTATTMVSDTTVTAGTTYYYVVSGTNSLGEGPRSAEVSAMPATPSGSLTITGTIKYEDKEYNQSVGLTGVTSFKAVRFADVELVNVTDNVIIASSTTATGYYRFDVSAASYGGDEVHVRIISSSTPLGANRVNVMDLTPGLYYVEGAHFTLAGSSTANLSIPTTNTADGAFNILDVMTSGYKFVDTYAATSPSDLNAYWQPNSSYGTYYCTGIDSIVCVRGAGIYVYNNYDTDEFDDDVLWHEFGHFIANNFSKDSSPGGGHGLTDNTQDLRLSWSEGWGDFFPPAVKFWLNATDPALLSAEPGMSLSQYVDTETGGLYLTVNIGAPETDACSEDECKYATNEISNANVLWSAMSVTALGMTKIWDVFENYMPTVTHDVNIEDFWDGWLANYTTDSTALHNVFVDRLIDYSADSYEPDNSGPAGQIYTQGSCQNHTLYGDGDVDYIRFTAIYTSHTISTYNLRNGADTKLTLFSGPSVTYPALTNDDAYPPITSTPPNTTTALSSKIQYTAFIPGQEYLMSVQRSDNNYFSAGRYGSYTLSITSP